MLKKRDRIVTRYLEKSHKFDKVLPKSVGQALALDAKHDNNLWEDVIRWDKCTHRPPVCVMPYGI